MEEFQYNLNGIDYEMVYYDHTNSVNIAVSDEKGKYAIEEVFIPVDIFRKMVEHFNAVS